MTSFTVTPVTGIGEVSLGTDLAALVADRADLRDGDVVAVTSKIVSKSEGRVVVLEPGQGREDVLDQETDRVVARRGPTTIVRTRHGLVMAAAGIDISNTAPGTAVLLPVDPDGTARRLREGLHEHTGVNVAVVVTDTSGRAWRTGQTDIAIGAAGLVVLDDHAGRTDRYGNPLLVTAPAVADEVAAAAELATGKLSASPVAVVRGLAAVVLTRGEHGAGAAALVREEASDMFGYGAREAVVRALAPGGDLRGFGAPASGAELGAALTSMAGAAAAVHVAAHAATVTLAEEDPYSRGVTAARLTALARAHGWHPSGPDDRTGPPEVLRFSPRSP
ncbi:MAG: Coenzyme F420-0:L-glutamate ligase @ F420-1:L-glutamate ligase / Nitroreductase family protein Rcas_3978 [uncultured Nocardioidaceae bacterium]|uniref:Coenzyme F420-0:L-glutamate ligase @ F420-1:L-glutamate ligase / Nitroreductase family protein Rcas_3978 n=1 Tax=uncultured Nocardioidaceae bacterium TaxID=253824 RepID=A0A6J4LUS5_9ACTN|nr:MAG: Coenzyme F420-0:L-glutamate ligase @ F420-1:L-glutamate ligase / Nitroreductase family protein Rcas_3978 [uncultured Nocardioidaceae bacterium]